MRTTVHLDGPGGPHQRVHKDLEVALSVIDLSSMTAAGPAQGSGPAQATASAQERLLAEWLDDDRRQGLDLTSRSVMRLSLLVFGTRRTVLVWTFHHALLDGRSSAMVLEEALDCYDALSGVVSGAAPAEQAEPVPFGRHVEAVSRADTSAARQFFIGQFDGWEGPEGGPGPPPHDSEQNLRRGHRELELRLPASWIERAERRAAEVDATVGSILLAAWSVLLSRWSDTDDVAFGTIRSGRHAVPDRGPDRRLSHQHGAAAGSGRPRRDRRRPVALGAVVPGSGPSP
ncbi:MAG: condensation domain-containing protein [Microthrixaceae bacterium]